MENKKIEQKALKETNAKKLLKIIEDNHLQNNEKIMKHFRKIDNDDAWNNNYYPRRKGVKENG